MELMIINRGYLPNQMPTSANDNYKSSILGGFSPQGLWGHMGGRQAPQQQMRPDSGGFSTQGLWSHMGRGQQDISCPVMQPFVPNDRSGGLWDIIRSMPAMTSYSSMDMPTPMDKVPLDQPPML